MPLFYGPRSEAARRAAAALPTKALSCVCGGAALVNLPIVASYGHMGVKTFASGIMLPEIAARHGSARPVLRQLRTKFFKKTRVEAKKKLQVASSLLMSREVFGSGAYPILSTTERQRVHTNVMGVYRSSVGESFSDHGHRHTDTEVLNIYDLRAPYTTIRFTRLRLSIRIACKAPFPLLVLLHACRSDSKSWLKALEDDLKWLCACSVDHSYTVTQWFVFCRASPKQARSLVRMICDGAAARSISLSEQSSAIRLLQSAVSCPCGWSGTSVAAFHGHRWSAHGYIAPAQHYADGSNECRCCLVRFSSRGLLISHLTRGSGICLLNCIIRFPPVNFAELKAARETDSILMHDNLHSGLPKHHAEVPASRGFGPLWPLYSLTGEIVTGW